MAFAITPVAAKDGNQNTIVGGLDFIDTSGTGAGPWIITKVTIDAAGVNVQGVLSNGAAKVDLASAAGTALAATANGLKVDGSAVTQPVSGAFWQATQPVSAASLPLPAGAATSALQTTINTTLGSPMQNSGGSVTANQGGTWTVQPGNTANTTAWKVDGSAVTQPVSGTFWQATQPVSIATLPALATGTNVIGSVEITDGTNTMAVKPASTIAAAADPAAVFTLSPNSYGVLTAGTAGSASTQVVSVQGIASMTPILVSCAAATSGGYSYAHISTDTTTVVKSGAGTLHTICVNTLAATGTITVYDNTAGSGTVIAIIGGGVQVSYLYDVAFATGLTIVTATAAPDITVSYK